MKKRCNIGNNLAEYAIPIALFGLVLGMGLYNFIESGTLKKFIESSNNSQVNASGTLVVK